jgi:hypothetical protein
MPNRSSDDDGVAPGDSVFDNDSRAFWAEADRAFERLRTLSPLARERFVRRSEEMDQAFQGL